VNRHFGVVASRLLELARDRPLLWAEQGGGQWAVSKEALLLDMAPADHAHEFDATTGVRSAAGSALALPTASSSLPCL
jgi:hypothetical protein